jgi:hypothetical protein
MAELVQWLQLTPSPIAAFIVACLCAVAIFKIFEWLDKKIRGPNRQTIIDMLNPGSGDHQASSAKAIREIFDRFYALHRDTSTDRASTPPPSGPYWEPLLKQRAVLRSSIITTVVSIILTYFIFKSVIAGAVNTSVPPSGAHPVTFWSGVDVPFLWGMPVNIVSDYLALFVIRMWLVNDQLTTRQAFWHAPLAGILLVISFMGLRIVLYLMVISISGGAVYDALHNLNLRGDDPHGPRSWSYIGLFNKETSSQIFWSLFKMHGPGALAALLVHLWLPLFAICVYVMKSRYYTLYAAKYVEGYLEKDHELEALGFVMAALVFVGTLSLYLVVWWFAPAPASVLGQV